MNVSSALLNVQQICSPSFYQFTNSLIETHALGHMVHGSLLASFMQYKDRQIDR